MKSCRRLMLIVEVLLWGALLTLAPGSRVQAEGLNMDFDMVSTGTLPRGWFVPTTGYRAEVVAENPKQGRHCLRLQSPRGARSSGFGNIMTAVDASPYRGKRVRLRAAIRAEVNPGQRAQMWLRVDRASQQRGFFDNMGDRPITSTSWSYYEIVGNVHDDAQRLNIGLMLLREGTVWLDDVTVKVVGEAVSVPVEKPRPLEKQGLDNLVAFTRLLGYIRHFHPSDQAASADWNAVAVKGMREVESAKDAIELATRLETIFRPLAPTVQVSPSRKRPGRLSTRPLTGKEPGLKTMRWKHVGFGDGVIRTIYSSERITERARTSSARGKHYYGKVFTASLGGVSCRVPLTLFADDDGTLPRPDDDGEVSEDKTAVTGAEYTLEDRATRLAGVALAWNVLQHFYPYFDVVKTDWPRELRLALERAAEDESEEAYLETLERLVAALHDGHGNVVMPGRSVRRLPLRWDWIEDAVVITGVAPAHSRSDIAVGDRIKSIAGVPIKKALAAVEERVSAATPQWRRHQGLLKLLQWRQRRVTLETITRGGTARTVDIETVTSVRGLENKRPEPIAEVDPGIFYVDIGRFDDNAFERALPRLEKATGIVIDMRGYPSGTQPFDVLGYLSARTLDSPQWHIPEVGAPDHKKMKFTRSGWKVRTRRPRLTAKLAFLTGGGAISAAETFMGMVEHHELGPIVGAATAGTNGNVNGIEIPGKIRILFTGMKVLKQDGSRHHGIGIRPTVKVAPTIAGTVAGRDEVLEKAIEVVKQ